MYNNPYSEVDWAQDYRLKAQHHDHTGIRANVLLAYDDAGYDVVSLMDYSGNPELPYAWQSRPWPPDQLLAPELLARLRSIKFFLPNAEEVGLRAHLTSPFLTTYIEGVPASSANSEKSGVESYQYASLDEAFSLIRSGNGFPCIAHPWRVWYADFAGSFCVEIYTAFAPASKHAGVSWFADRAPDELVQNWDWALQQNQEIWGIAVNDHFGPQRRRGDLPPEIVDSGKIVVLAKKPTLDAYKEAFVNGAFFAVQDRGTIKDRYPQVDSIIVTSQLISIETWGTVTWKANHATVAEGPTLMLSALPSDSHYVRAEIRGIDESVVYTQPFALRPWGDVDGDYKVTTADVALCDSEIDDPNLQRLCDEAPYQY